MIILNLKFFLKDGCFNLLRDHPSEEKNQQGEFQNNPPLTVNQQNFKIYLKIYPGQGVRQRPMKSKVTESRRGKK